MSPSIFKMKCWGARLVQILLGTTSVVSPWMHWLHYVQTMSYCNMPPYPLGLPFFPPLLPWWLLSIGGETLDCSPSTAIQEFGITLVKWNWRLSASHLSWSFYFVAWEFFFPLNHCISSLEVPAGRKGSPFPFRRHLSNTLNKHVHLAANYKTEGQRK